MTEAIQRGSVVLRDGGYAVVWGVSTDKLVLLPILRVGGEARAHDVELGFGDLLGGGIGLPDALVRAGEPVLACSVGQVRVGAMGGTVLCRIVSAVARAYQDARTEQVWSAERTHRHEAASVRAVRQ